MTIPNGSKVRVITQRRPNVNFIGKTGTVIEFVEGRQYRINLDTPVGGLTQFFGYRDELERIPQTGMNVTELIAALTYASVEAKPDAEVFIENENRSELDIGRVVVDYDGDIIIEFKRDECDSSESECPLHGVGE